MLPLRENAGLPDPNIQPPQIARSGDPFARLRVVHLVARIPRGAPVRLRDIVDRLNADYLDWDAFGHALADHIRHRNSPAEREQRKLEAAKRHKRRAAKLQRAA